MYEDNNYNELHPNRLTHNFDTRSFMMCLRRHNENHRELATLEHERCHPLKYCSWDNLRGFDRLNKYDGLTANYSLLSHMISPNGIIITDNFSKQMLEENLLVVRCRWQKSKRSISNKTRSVQSKLDEQINISLKKTSRKCQDALLHWISKIHLEKSRKTYEMNSRFL